MHASVQQEGSAGLKALANDKTAMMDAEVVVTRKLLERGWRLEMMEALQASLEDR
jgi:hypothetical protein